MLSGSGRFTLPYLPGGLRKTAVPSRGGGTGARFPIFVVSFRMQKNVEKTERQKSTFFAIFGDFGSPRRRFLAIFGPKTGSQRLMYIPLVFDIGCCNIGDELFPSGLMSMVPAPPGTLRNTSRSRNTPEHTIVYYVDYQQRGHIAIRRPLWGQGVLEQCCL